MGQPHSQDVESWLKFAVAYNRRKFFGLQSSVISRRARRVYGPDGPDSSGSIFLARLLRSWPIALKNGSTDLFKSL
jgi:hypothetical protein